MTNILYTIERHPKPAHRPGAIDNSIGKDDPGKVIVATRDTGCGIPREHRQMVHRPCQSTNKRGVGMGLCHTRPIVGFEGGQIRSDSQLNHGSIVLESKGWEMGVNQ